MSDPAALDITDAAAALAGGAFSAQDLLQAYLARIERYEDGLNCFITLLAEPAREQAKAADARHAEGRRLSPLDGIPIALKDNIDLAGVPTTNGMAKFRTPENDSAVAQRLRQAGAVIIGKANMHEGALGATSDNHHHGACHNPWRPGYTPGGSSGGSAAAVAARLCAGALGTDTMGSVRLPAAYCGLAGLKPTYGLISTRGVVPLSYGLDHVGPICRSARDLSLLLAVLAGYDPDCTESIHPHGALRASPADLKGLRFAVPLSPGAVPCETGIWEDFEGHVETLCQEGAIRVDLRLANPDPTGTRLAGLLISEAEAGHALEAELLTRPGDFSDEFRHMLNYGRDAAAHRLVAAQRRLRATGHGLRKLLDQVELLLLPTAAQAAFPFAQPAPVNQADFTQWANHGGCPALSLPCGVSPDGMPLGLQLIGRPLADGQLLARGEAIAALLPRLPAPDLQ
ncbi:MAG: amidase [Alphaproteobacteria bacterium]|jgi:aspartyl-tRNA(Asn)/glutamyl-tRNA(Gln) amidotransferase subunit A|nr:amidase [Alphaproteobacteria bacterium]